MTAKYMISGDMIIKTIGLSTVPADPTNPDWIEYQQWLTAGNVPDPYIPPPEVHLTEKSDG